MRQEENINIIFSDNNSNNCYTAQSYGNAVQPMNEAYLPFLNGTTNKPARKKKFLLIFVICVAVALVWGVIIAQIGFFDNSQKYIEKYEQSKDLSDLYSLCNYYDNSIYKIKDYAQAEKYYEIALGDTKEFLRTYNPDTWAGQFQSADDAYYYFTSDYLYLMIKNGEYDRFVMQFTYRMLETDPIGNYYFDSYAIVDGTENSDYPLTEEEKLIVIKGFENLIGACIDDEEKHISLQEYYYCCDTFKLYDQTDKVGEQLSKYEKDAENV